MRFLQRYRGLPREIYILFVARVINSIGAFVHPLLALILTDKIGFSEGTAGLCMTILMLTQFPAVLLGGKLADKFGRKKLIITFQILGAATYMVCGLIQPSIALVVLMMLASNFYAMTTAAMDAVTGDLTHIGNRKEAISILYMGSNLGFAVGPMIGGLLFKNLLPLVFIGDAFTTIVMTVLIAIFIKETLPQKDSGKAGADANGLEKYREGSVWSILKERKVILFFALIMLIYEFSYSQWAFALPIQMKGLFTDGAAQYGMLASFNGLLVIILTHVITTIIRRWRPLRAATLAGVLYAAAYCMLIFVRDLPFFYLSMFLFTTGEILNTIDARSFLVNFSPSSHRGRLNSVMNIISSSGRMMSPLVIGTLIASGGTAAGFTAVSVAAIAGAGLLFTLFCTSRLLKRNAVHIEDANAAEAIQQN
jgi:MFS family permease